jgi:hypothetical protein
MSQYVWCVETFKIDIIVLIGNLMCFTSHWQIKLIIKRSLLIQTISFPKIKGNNAEITDNQEYFLIT